MANLSDLKNAVYWQINHTYTKNYAKSIGAAIPDPDHPGWSKTVKAIDLENGVFFGNPSNSGTTVEFGTSYGKQSLDSDSLQAPTLSVTGLIETDSLNVNGIKLSSCIIDGEPVVKIMNKNGDKFCHLRLLSSDAYLATTKDINTFKAKISTDNESISLLLDIMQYSDSLSSRRDDIVQLLTRFNSEES